MSPPFERVETIQRLMDDFLRDSLSEIPPEQHQQFVQQFEQRFAELLQNSTNGSGDGFLDLVGFGDSGPIEFENIAYPHVQPDFDDSVIPSQLHAAAELYYIYQHERMKVFKVVNVLSKLFRLGKMRIQRGPGARALYLVEKWKPLRYNGRDRMIAYRRAFNYGTSKAPAGAVVNVNFHGQLVSFMVAVAQYFRDLNVSEVIRGGPMLNQRPFGSAATVQRLAIDLRYALDRSTYGNIFALTMEVGHYLRSILSLLDAPDIKKAFDANTKWNVIEAVSNRYLGGTSEPSQRAKMAESGRRILQFVASNNFDTAVDPAIFQAQLRPIGPHAEAWLAAYRTTPEGQKFPGVTPALKSTKTSKGLPM